MYKTVFVLMLAVGVIGCSDRGAQQPSGNQGAPSASGTPSGQPQSPATAQSDASQPAASQPAPSQPAAPPSPSAPPPTARAAAPHSNAAPSEAQPAPPPPRPPAPPKPEFVEVTLPAGTSLSVTLLSTLASTTSKVEDPVKGSLARPIVVNGTTVVPAGAQISGTVTDAKESGRVKGRASVSFRFDRLVVGGETYRIQTASVKQEAAADTKNDVKKGAAGGGLGAIIGGVAGGGKGAAIGAVAGGTAAVVGTKGQEVELQPGTAVTALLQEPVTVTIRVR